MKKILGLVAGLLLTAVTFAQSGVAFNDSGEDYNKLTATSFHFDFDSNYTIEDINKAATYYVSYFTVDAVSNENGSTITISLVDDNDMGRRVMTRFFVSLEVENISASGSEMTVDEFMALYIMK